MVQRIKYKRTWHLPFCENIGDDGDHTLSEDEVEEHFIGKLLIMTEKMDGENTTLYNDGIHARSISSPSTEWRTYLQGRHAAIKHLIPHDARICGENMYAKHSIFYEDLEDYFYVFNVFQKGPAPLVYNWWDVVDVATELGFPTVPFISEIYLPKEKTYDDFKKECLSKFEEYKKTLNRECEGFVLRNAFSFEEKDFKKNVTKFVRKNHVQTSEHWTKERIVKNVIKKK